MMYSHLLATTLFPGCVRHLPISVTKLPKKQFKGGMIYSGLWFQKFKSVVSWLHYFQLQV